MGFNSVFKGLKSKNYGKCSVTQNGLKSTNSKAGSRPEQRDCTWYCITLLLRRVRCRLQNNPFCCYWRCCCCLFADQNADRWAYSHA